MSKWTVQGPDPAWPPDELAGRRISNAINKLAKQIGDGDPLPDLILHGGAFFDTRTLQWVSAQELLGNPPEPPRKRGPGRWWAVSERQRLTHAERFARALWQAWWDVSHWEGRARRLRARYGEGFQCGPPEGVRPPRHPRCGS